MGTEPQFADSLGAGGACRTAPRSRALTGGPGLGAGAGD